MAIRAAGPDRHTEGRAGASDARQSVVLVAAAVGRGHQVPTGSEVLLDQSLQLPVFRLVTANGNAVGGTVAGNAVETPTAAKGDCVGAWHDRPTRPDILFDQGRR